MSAPNSMLNRFLIALVVVSLFGNDLSAQESIDFQRDVLPILSDKCFVCHGPDEQTREGGFRLDVKESALGEARSGEIPVVPGNVESSELIYRIQLDSSDFDVMPPASEEKQLTEREKAVLRQWISEGAPWKNHWAFEPIQSPQVPDVVNKDWVRNPIDHFVLSKLEQMGLDPAEAAPQHSLARRSAFDVTGLPPSLEELDSFLKDTSDGKAYSRWLNHLFEQPQYGEHMATQWLDSARFADTNGYQNDFKRSMWLWRDWVIDAYNQNMAYDKFVVDQIAGDMLDDPSLDQIVATGFNRNHRTVTEGGSIEEEWFVENVVDRVETTSTVFLGLTMGCARCHDHKYDPISQREFYQFFAFFNNANEKGFHNEKRGNVPPLVRVRTERHQERFGELDRLIQEVKGRLADQESSLTENQAVWEAELSKRTADRVSGQIPEPLIDEILLADLRDQSRVVGGAVGDAVEFDRNQKMQVELPSEFQFHGDQPFSFIAWVKPEKNGAVISRMDGRDNYRGFDSLIIADGRIEFHLIHRWPTDAIKVTTKVPLKFSRWQHLAVTWDGSQKAAGFKVFVNGEPIAVDVNTDALFGPTDTGHALWLGLRDETPRFEGWIAGARVFERMLDRDDVARSFQGRIIDAIKNRDDWSNPTEERAEDTFLNDIYRGAFVPSFRKLEEELEKLVTERAQLESNIPTTMVMEERQDRRKTFILERGQYDKPIEEDPVEPGIPAFLPQPDYPINNRRDLARWLVDPANPLTARVAVNRIWEQYFGLGLLETSENFGVQSPVPSHPELLDWLAAEFIRSGWDVQSLQKLILNSATYRQSSQVSADRFLADPSNRLLSRGPRFRLGAEAVRDNALALGGLLVNRVGGPSIKPYQPDRLWNDLAGGAGEGEYVQDHGDALYRRSLYIYRKRTVPHPTMSTFDAGSREICQVARSRTNTPLQALALLNDPTYVEAARGLATQALVEEDSAGRLKYMFRRATCRLPEPRELKALQSALFRYERRFQEDPDAARAFLSVGELPMKDGIDPQRLAALTAVASVILNLDETITKE